jgi:tRNA A37 threonylcarbamoyladenosine biosynthesis protein TsaE
MSQLEIKRFDMKSIVFKQSAESEGPVIVMIGKRGTGKSMLVKHLLFHHRDIPVGTVISGTEIGNHFYASIIPRLFIYHSYESEIIHSVRESRCDNVHTRRHLIHVPLLF